VYAKVDNLTDKYYQVVDGYATAQRSYYAGLSAKF
jgi:vitamin B12 transporter